MADRTKQRERDHRVEEGAWERPVAPPQATAPPPGLPPVNTAPQTSPPPKKEK